MYIQWTSWIIFNTKQMILYTIFKKSQRNLIFSFPQKSIYSWPYWSSFYYSYSYTYIFYIMYCYFYFDRLKVILVWFRLLRHLRMEEMWFWLHIDTNMFVSSQDRFLYIYTKDHHLSLLILFNWLVSHEYWHEYIYIYVKSLTLSEYFEDIFNMNTGLLKAFIYGGWEVQNSSFNGFLCIVQ